MCTSSLCAGMTCLMCYVCDLRILDTWLRVLYLCIAVAPPLLYFDLNFCACCGLCCCRPHGFASVGRVTPDSPLGRLLLHGLHMFLATSLDPQLLQRLHRRHAQ